VNPGAAHKFRKLASVNRSVDSTAKGEKCVHVSEECLIKVEPTVPENSPGFPLSIGDFPSNSTLGWENLEKWP
jgi:hypothetical protein